MTSVRSWAALASVGLAVSAATVASGTPASAASTSGRAALSGSFTPASERSRPAGNVAAGSMVSFDLSLTLRDAAGAKAILTAVSTPGSAQYRHYLTDAQWIARYAPTQASVATAETWLRSQGFKVGKVPADRLFIPATGTASQVARAFNTTLGEFVVKGQKVRLASTPLSIPASISGAVAGVVGVNQELATNDLSQSLAGVAGATPSAEPPPPAAFQNPEPCSNSWNSKTDTTDKGSLYSGFTAPLGYDICGYKPQQLESAYGLSASIAAGNDGSGVKIAIVDAYDSPTLLKDAQRYFSTNDPSIPLASTQFTNMKPSSVANADICGGSGWYAEQALDVESSHAMAPGAHIIFVGAQDCFDNNLLAAVDTAITSGASVVSDSWGDTLGDLFADAATHTAFDNTFLMAAETGVSVLFSSGDSGDNFAISGLAVPDYPPTSPLVTSVGGTTLEVGASGARAAEEGWSTGKQILCGPVAAKNCGSATTPEGAMGFNAGAGGGTSYYYLQPSYQAGVVPAALALRNENLFGPVPLRVEPDISMDADAQSGMLIGLTETFPTGVRYGQFKEGGTSLASPLLAGVIADTDQAAGGSVGFLNPTIYSVDLSHPAAFDDIVPPANPKTSAVIRVDYANTVNASNGFLVSLRVVDYQGTETYCDGTGNCVSRLVTLTTAKGFDGITGIGTVGAQFIKRVSQG